MKQYKYLLTAALAASMFFSVSCADEIVLVDEDNSKYEAVNKSYGYVRNAVAPVDRLVDLYQADVTRALEVGITRKMNRAVTVTATIDERVLDQYNDTNYKSYAMFPPELVRMGQNGKVVIPPGYMTADPFTITISPSAELDENLTYVIPLEIATDDTDVELTTAQRQYFFFVNYKGEKINPAKNAGYVVMSCMETGNADPRIHCELFLKNEGKPLFDMVVLFSANLNYNESTGKVYIHMNNSVSAILNNRERYIKPLQDMGIKVLLGLMGNHDPAGVSHLSESTAIEFIDTQVKPCIEHYGLDGVFWDDEYTAANASIPGFVAPSRANASRLIFEFKKAMPDKLNTVFSYGTYINGLSTVDGVAAGEYTDYFTSDYTKSLTMSSWGGATTKQGMVYPYELALQRLGRPETVVSGNWGGIMLFAIDTYRANWNTYQIPAMQNVASTMFGDELHYTGVSYPLEW